MKGRSIGDGEGRLSGPAEGPSVLLGQAYHLRFDPKLWAGQQPYPPLGSLYALSVLREAGFDVRFHDSMLAESEAEWAGALDRETPRFAVLYEDNFNYLTKMCLLRMREAAVTMIQAAKQRGCTVIVAGSDATDHPEPYLDAGADWVIAGEGDLTLRELLEMLSTGQPVKSVPGLVYRGEAGETVRTIPRPILRNLDTLPLPAWDLIDFGRYRALWKTSGVVNATYALNLVTSRGCPYHCNWCAKPIWGQRYNARSPESVVEEMAW
ncbi:MAG: cobalamin-dependent protein, partial [Bacteroidota bacterium]